MTYNTIVDIILSKLNLTPEEAAYDRVLNRIPHLCNEALGDIANRGKPLYKMYIINITEGTVTPSTLIENESVSATRFITFPAEFLNLTNEFIQRCPITVTDGEIEETGEYERVDGRHFRRLSSRQLLFPNEFEYRYLVQATCRYPKIVGDEDEEIEIDDNILELLPNYVVSEILRVDDLSLSVVYRNLYESALAALDDSVLDPAGNLYDERW